MAVSIVDITFAHPIDTSIREIVNTSDRWLALRTIAAKHPEKMSSVLLVTVSHMEYSQLEKSHELVQPIAG